MTDKPETKSAKGPRRAIVRGRVMNPDGSPVAGERVQAYTKRLRKGDEPLGKPARTGKDGGYRIEYDPAKWLPDLYVQVRRGEEVVATSAVVLGAGSDETIDVVVGGVYRGPSQHRPDR